MYIWMPFLMPTGESLASPRLFFIN